MEDKIRFEKYFPLYSLIQRSKIKNHQSTEQKYCSQDLLPFI